MIDAAVGELIDAEVRPMRLRVLGPLEVTGGPGRQLPPRVHDLLALLSCRPNVTIPAEQLIHALWSGEPPRTSAKSLQVRVYELRRALGDPSRILHRRQGYALAVSPAEVDAGTFEDLLARGRAEICAGRPADGTESLRRALALWRGPAFAGHDHLDPVRLEATRLDELHLQAVEELADAELALGRHAEIIERLLVAQAQHPFRERVSARLMLALHRVGRSAEALRVYRALSERLDAELGTPPCRELRELSAAILAEDPALDRPAVVVAAPSFGPPPAPAELPAEAAAFTGRTGEAELLRATLTRHTGRTVVCAINGPGGVGKSALAVQMAAEVGASFPDGQLFVDLRGASTGLDPLSPADVLARFLRSLGVAAPPDIDEAAARFRSVTATRRMLVVLDNAVDANQVRPLLPGGRGCAVVVTSRKVLSTLDGATHLPVAPLTGDEAVTLLGRLAGAERVAREPAAAADIVRYCGRLPLAVRITGARLLAQPARSLAAHAGQLADTRRRLDALEHADLAVRASIAASHHDLAGRPAGPAALMLLKLVAALHLPDITTTLAAALGQVPDGTAAAALDRLVETQLLQEPAGGRYPMHDLIRLHARELAAVEISVAEWTAALHRVVDHYAAAGEQATRLLDNGQARWMTGAGDPAGPSELCTAADAIAWVDAERANLVGLVSQAAERAGTAPAAIRLAAAISTPMDVRGHLREWIECNRAVVAAAERLGDPRAQARARMFLGYALGRLGRNPEEIDQAEQALVLWRAVGDRFGESGASNACGLAYLHGNRLAEAVAHLERGLALRRATGDPYGEAMLLDNLGGAYRVQGRVADAIAAHERALTLAEEIGNLRSRAHALGNLATDLNAAGEYDRALSYHRQSIAGHRATGDLHHEASGRWALGQALHRLGKAADARRQWDAALAILQETGRLTAGEVQDIRCGPVGAVPTAIKVLNT
jgi:DNA-binding SARP family transcriptional activator/tetratricopeptide (TPR) repeat protein